MIKGTSLGKVWGALLSTLAVLASCKSAEVGTTAKMPANASTAEVAPAKRVVVYGSTGRSIHVFDFDTKTGALELRQTVGDLKNDVHYMAIHPSHRALYVSVSEIPPPKDRPWVSAIYAFAIDPHSGALTQLGEPYTSPLGRAVNINVDNSGKYLLMANNFAESASVLALKPDGSLDQAVKQPE